MWVQKSYHTTATGLALSLLLAFCVSSGECDGEISTPQYEDDSSSEEAPSSDFEEMPPNLRRVDAHFRVLPENSDKEYMPPPYPGPPSEMTNPAQAEYITTHTQVISRPSAPEEQYPRYEDSAEYNARLRGGPIAPSNPYPTDTDKLVNFRNPPMPFAPVAYRPTLFQHDDRPTQYLENKDKTNDDSESSESEQEEDRSPPYHSYPVPQRNVPLQTSTGLFRPIAYPSNLSPRVFHFNLTHLPFPRPVPMPPNVNPLHTMSDKLNAARQERIRIRAVILQLQDILQKMHVAIHSPEAERLQEKPAELRMNRLRNLFIVMNAATKLRELTPEELSHINYAAGFFDPRSSEENRIALMHQMAQILRQRPPINDNDSSEGEPEQKTSEDPEPTVKPTEEVTTPPPEERTADKCNGSLNCRLTRVRNLYIMVKSLITGKKVTRGEAEYMLGNNAGFFEPGLTDMQKMQVISFMVAKVRAMRGEAPPHRSIFPFRQPHQYRVLVPLPGSPMATVSASVTSDPPSSEKIHVSGKISADLNIDGNVDPNSPSQGILSRLL